LFKKEENMRRLFITVIALMAISIGLYAQEKDTAQMEPKVELKVVYEKTFDEPIVDVIFDSATVSIEEAIKMGWKEEAFTAEDRAEGIVIVSYPKVVITPRREDLSHWNWETQRNSGYVKDIRFYNKKGILLNSIELGWPNREQIHISPQKKYVLVRTVPYEFDPQYLRGTLYNWNGEKIWEKSGPHPIAVSDEGYTVSAYLDWQCPPEPEGSFYVYDPSGKLIKTIENPDKKQTAPLFAEYTSDSEFAVLVFQGAEVPTIIYLVRKTGDIVWKRTLAEYRFSARAEEVVALSNEGLVGIFDLIKRLPSGEIEEWKTYVFYLDWRGYLKWQTLLETRGNMIMRIAEDRKKVYVASGAGYLWCIDMSNGKILWRHKEHWVPNPQVKKPWPWDVPRFRELEIINDTLYMIGKQGRDWHSSVLFVFNGESGSLLNKIEFPQEKIFFATSENKIGLINTTKNKVLFFKEEVQK
jgi:outer membrane protein assembly factor BamB